jgi:hypothetical protein
MADGPSELRIQPQSRFNDPRIAVWRVGIILGAAMTTPIEARTLADRIQDIAHPSLLEALRSLADQVEALQSMTAVIYDGWAVYEETKEFEGPRLTILDVSAVLDAVSRIWTRAREAT